MTVSRRDLMAFAATGVLGSLASEGKLIAEQRDGGTPGASPMPTQVPSDRAPSSSAHKTSAFDIRDGLHPRRLTMAMWDQAYALRHTPGASFADYDRVLDETVERGYNTVRIDPMPEWIDLTKPERIFAFDDPQQPFMPWGWNTAVKGPVGLWITEFIEKLHKRPSINYTLSAWWTMPGAPGSPGVPAPLRKPSNLVEGAEMWAVLLTDWKKQFGFDRIVYVDIANEMPYFFPDFMDRLKKASGAGFDDPPALSASQIAFLAGEMNKAISLLQREFPELRFTASIHGDLRWLDVPLEVDCLDVHFYADADPRWTARTRFNEFIGEGLFKNDRWFAEFSERSKKTAAAIAPMLRQRQRFKVEEFANWAARRGTPLTTSESWSSWYYIDHPKLDWGWLLDWASWSVDDAIDFKFWGWTPHNYVQPQFANWKNAKWHRTLNERFLKG